MKDSVLVVGSFGYRNNQLDGQTIKTRQVTRLLKERYDGRVESFCTQNLCHRPWAVAELLAKMARCRTVVMLYASSGGYRNLMPVLCRLASLTRTRVVYIAIGGGQADCFAGKRLFENKPKPHLAKLYRTLHGFMPESKLVMDELAHDWGFERMDIFPNFRYFDQNASYQPASKDGTLRLVYLGRIMKTKGYELACDFFRRHTGLDITLDFYGQLDGNCNAHFLATMEELKDKGVCYKGALKPEEITQTLRTYDAMVFPTYFEGIPGTVIDAFIASLPVVCTEWRFAREMVDDEENGFIVPLYTEDTQRLFDERILQLYADRNLLNTMKRKAHASRLRYTPDAAWDALEPFLQ